MKHKKLIIDGKYVPQRMCIACRGVFAKNEMFRFINANGNVLLDRHQSQNGRGAYLCKSKTCIDKAQKIRALERALRCTVLVEIFDALKTSL